MMARDGGKGFARMAGMMGGGGMDRLKTMGGGGSRRRFRRGAGGRPASGRQLPPAFPGLGAPAPRPCHAARPGRRRRLQPVQETLKQNPERTKTSMLKIRLARGGAKKRPYYSIVVADSHSPRDGRFIEKVGAYNPLLKKDDPQARDAEGRAHQRVARQGRPAHRPRGAVPRHRRAWPSGQPSNNPKKGEPHAKAKERVKRARRAAPPPHAAARTAEAPPKLKPPRRAEAAARSRRRSRSRKRPRRRRPLKRPPPEAGAPKRPSPDAKPPRRRRDAEPPQKRPSPKTRPPAPEARSR